MTGGAPLDASNARRKAERRTFIRDHHPDRGGDAETFIAGLDHRSGISRFGEHASVVFRRRPRGTRRAVLLAKQLAYRTIRRPKPKPRVR